MSIVFVFGSDTRSDGPNCPAHEQHFIDSRIAVGNIEQIVQMVVILSAPHNN